jgi:hypothetical protein
VKKRVVIYGTLIIVLTLAWEANSYATELSAVMWHVRHGFHTQIGDIKVRVPLAYEADDPHRLPSHSISRMPGRLSGPGGIIMFDFQRRLPSPEQMKAAEALLQKKGFKSPLQIVKVAERPAVFAGRPGKCIEYSAEVGELALGTEIDCGFEGDVSAQYIGSSNLRDDFYNIIQTADRVKRKN